MKPRDILRAEYGSSRNFITPEVLHYVAVTHPETGEHGAAEISMGDGIRLREHEQRGVKPRCYGVSVVWCNEGGGTRRTTSDEPHGSRVFVDEPADADYWDGRFTGEGYAAACEYLRTLGADI